MDSNHGEENRKAVSDNTAATSLLNQFILGQLKEKHCANGEIGARNGFVLPKLQLGTTKTTNFVIPPLKISNSNNALLDKSSIQPTILSKTFDGKSYNDGIGEISRSVDKMQLNDSEIMETKIELSSPAIDLTAALSSVTGIIVQSKQRLLQPAEDFQIPFIECDRQEKPILLPIIDNYCHSSTDATTMYKSKTLVPPSSCGRIICLKYKRTRPLPKISHRFKVKHKIQRFRFDTKSPDDIILATLNKYHRQY